MSRPFIIPEKTSKERTIYLPMELYNIVCREMNAAGAVFTPETIHRQLLRGQMPVPQELLAWKERFELDGHEPVAENAFDRITSPYDPVYIYQYAQHFFGPTIDPEYKKELEDAMAFNHELFLQEQQ